MPNTITLNKANPLLPAEDYNALRKQGFKAIERLGSGLWTDYNNSDPGITILEALCYAITDLAYRTGFDVKDLLAPEALDEDTWRDIFYTARQILHNCPLTANDYRKLIVDVKGVRNAWIEKSKDYETPLWVDYNAWELRHDHDCTCADPGEHVCVGKLRLDSVTKELALAGNNNQLKQLQERLAELQKRQNALIGQQTKLKNQYDGEPEGSPERLVLAPQLASLSEQIAELKEKIGTLTAIIEAHTYAKPEDYPFVPEKILELEGLYNIIVEYEEDVLDEQRREAVRQTVLQRLARRRNLCEDFLNVTAVDYQDFNIGAGLALEEYADPDLVVAQMFFAIYQYFTPSVPFHTIGQMLDKGYSVDEIFEGPALKHGFIDTEELEKTALYRDLRLSDIINVIADIKGVKAVLYLHLPLADFADAPTDKQFFNEWLAELRSSRKIARIRPEQSQVLLCKEHEFISYYTDRADNRRPARMLKLFKDMKTLERKYKLEGCALDFPVPAGENMELEDYFPVTESLPMCYGVGTRAGLPGEEGSERRTQALQLKGYLMMFEQLLADHLVQLNHLRDLFSFADTVKHSYFGRVLEEIDQLQALLIDQNGLGAGHFDDIKRVFRQTLQNLLETPEQFGIRRNIFLDHMLARFGENFGEYEAIMRYLEPGHWVERLRHDKCRALENGEYYRISSKRGLGYDYAAPRYWDTWNVSGTERRIGRLLGFPSIERRTLAPDNILVEALLETDPATKLPVPKKNAKGQPLNVIKVVDPENHEQQLLISVDVIDGCCTEDLMTALLAAAGERNHYRMRQNMQRHGRKSAGPIGQFWYELWDGTDPETAILLGHGPRFKSQAERDHALHRLLAVVAEIDRNEGLHLIEHLLLRPRFDEVFDEVGQAVEFKPLDICLDACDIGIGIEEVETPPYQKRIRRIPAERCYDQMPWVLEYLRYNPNNESYDLGMLYQSVPMDGSAPAMLKFRRYEALAQHIQALQEYGAERSSYEIVSNQAENPDKPKYGFIIHGHKGKVLAQSPYAFNLKPANKKSIKDDVEKEIETMMRYFDYEFDLFCEANPCDNDEDPYSFRTTVVLPCWPKRFRDGTFRNLVEKTIRAESPAHVHSRIVWIGIGEMRRFEEAYTAWLLELSQTEMPSPDKTTPLVEVLNTLRPCGSCADDCG